MSVIIQGTRVGVWSGVIVVGDKDLKTKDLGIGIIIKGGILGRHIILWFIIIRDLVIVLSISVGWKRSLLPSLSVLFVHFPLEASIIPNRETPSTP